MDCSCNNFNSNTYLLGVAGGLLVKALDYESKDPGGSSPTSSRDLFYLLGALSPTSEIE